MACAIFGMVRKNAYKNVYESSCTILLHEANFSSTMVKLNLGLLVIIHYIEFSPFWKHQEGSGDVAIMCPLLVVFPG